MLKRLLALQERGRSLINLGRSAASEIMGDNALRNEIDALYRHYYGRAITGCKNCYCDALIELCSINKEKAMSKTDLFVVHRGKVLKDVVNHDTRKNLVRGNETVELALYHLYTNPGSRRFFEKLPDDDRLDEMIAEYAETFEAERGAKNGVDSGSAATDKVLNDAADEAANIIEAAKEEVAKIVGDAKNEAMKIVEDATIQAANIIKDAEDEAAKINALATAAAPEPKEPAKAAKKTAASDPILK